MKRKTLRPSCLCGEKVAPGCNPGPKYYWQLGLGYGIISCVPRKIRELVADLERGGFVVVPGGKGSHRKFRHPKHAGSLILSGHNGDDAHHYQERQVRKAIREANS